MMINGLGGNEKEEKEDKRKKKTRCEEKIEGMTRKNEFRPLSFNFLPQTLSGAMFLASGVLVCPDMTSKLVHIRWCQNEIALPFSFLPQKHI